MKKFALWLLGIFFFSCEQPDAFVVNKKPMMGWSSWNHYHVNISEEIIKSQVDALKKLGLDKFGYRYINIDDGFWGGRDKNGKILVHPKRFPKGMRELSDYIHSKGLLAGIYTDAGIYTCGSYGDDDTIGVENGLFGHQEEDLRTLLIDWNYDFIKVDWCGGWWLDLDEQTRYTSIIQMIRSIKPQAKVNVCRWEFPGKWVTYLADSWRISGDITLSFESILKIIDLNADLWMYSSQGHYNDMDMLQVGRGMSYEEDKTHFTMWCLMHSPLILGNDLTKMDSLTFSIITNQELIALNQSDYVYQARRVYSKDSVEMWAKPLISTMSGKVAVALLNRSQNIRKGTIDLAGIGFDLKKEYTVRDLWLHQDLGKNIPLSFEISPHGVRAFVIEGTITPFNYFQKSERHRYDKE
ncbi:MAG: glycoside hydrolase family 27 protein [Cytophagales bacterium]|nr:glycoside hydrolase family 27 protein [Cytophagales bacterium]MDW8383188.1 glycoside hydrolase family 27 protein [Flammeovirgaceae bacterium]